MTLRYSLSPPSESEGFARNLLTRRSVREYTGEPLTLDDIGRLLWAGQGVSHSSGKRTAPSPHALHPLELYAVVGDVTDVEPGLYHYELRSHALDAVGHGDLRQPLRGAALDDQPWVELCAALIVIAGDRERSLAEFADQTPDGRRGDRYLHMEAGAVAQNIALQAEEVQVGTVLVAGFDDERVKALLGIEFDPLALLPVGRIPG